jgi:hypothetical protein
LCASFAPILAPRPGARQYKYFIRDTDWNICSIRVGVGRITQASWGAKDGDEPRRNNRTA